MPFSFSVAQKFSVLSDTARIFFSFEMNGCFKLDVRRNMVRYVWSLKTFRVAPEDLTALRKLLPPKYRELVSWKIFLANILLFPIK